MQRILTLDVFGGAVTILLAGKPTNWRITTKDESDPALLDTIGTIAKNAGAQAVLAPRPAEFNALICKDQDLSASFSLGNSGISIHRGYNADGCEIPEQKAFFLASADCTTIVGYSDKTHKVIAAHAGRDSLIDRNRINNGDSRQHESVVDAVIEAFENSNPSDLHFFLTCGIGPNNFGHDLSSSKKGLQNIWMIDDILERYESETILAPKPYDHGKINLYELIKAQLMSFGVPSYQIGFDGIDTYTAKNTDGEIIFWSNRRGDKLSRNMVMVVNNRSA